MKKIILGLFVILGVFFAKSTNAQVFDSPPRDGVFDKIHTTNRQPVPYAYVREADVFFSKRIWRVIDMREKINHPLYYPTERINNRRSLMQVFIDGIAEGSLTAYDASSDEFLIPMSIEQALSILYHS